MADTTDPVSLTGSLFRKSKGKKNLRKREKSPSPEPTQDVTSEVKIKERKLGESNPMVQGTKREKVEDSIQVKYTSTGTALPVLSQDANATAVAEWDTETDRDAQAILERKLAAEGALEDDGLYRGASGYKTFITKRDTAAGNAASSKIRAGPIRASSNIRVTCRFDYQPDICKDYKETGFCGYGDSCIFMHDRGDYKSGWQLEKEWEEAQKNKRINDFVEEEVEEEESEEELPFACLICREEFTRPVVTKCGHYFCEACALKRYAKTPKCFACSAPTGGIFNTAKQLIAKLNEKKKRELEAHEKESNSDDNEQQADE
ncbi:RING finger protein 113A [Basidiobolus meristosporus CBS 931.73]|uniref:Pre-mRNA-splicing factor CWC24 n=1 Tax=Basidiobolus meristosporus CBS 931.73 TaxID=1314790 RepID=A0A1Y1Y4Y1_9FUNG|nr:RING finger protein 113A [Basidiobolus meristosporus CBS 931.73]|eukprot:ORX92999.1 RING finger protein 113A [Basidiobolus meristosporus CBS 931.73]